MNAQPSNAADTAKTVPVESKIFISRLFSLSVDHYRYSAMHHTGAQTFLAHLAFTVPLAAVKMWESGLPTSETALHMCSHSFEAQNLNQTRSNGRAKADEPARDPRQEGVRLAPQQNSVNHRTNVQQARRMNITHMWGEKKWKNNLNAVLSSSIHARNCVHKPTRAHKRGSAVLTRTEHIAASTAQQWKDLITDSLCVKSRRRHCLWEKNWIIRWVNKTRVQITVKQLWNIFISAQRWGWELLKSSHLIRI